MGRLLDHVGVGAGLVGDAVHDVDEAVEGVAALILGGLNHHCLMEEEREVDGGRVEAVVEETLSHVERGDARRLVAEAIEHELMHAGAADGQLVVVLEALLDVVGVERGEGTDILDVLAAEREDEGVGAQLDAEVTGPCADVDHRSVDLSASDGVLEAVAVAFLDDDGTREELLEALAHTDGTGAGTTATMRRGERLVEVDVHHVEAHVAGAADAKHRVEVGTVVVHQRAAVVDEAGNLGNLILEETEGVGVGHHHRGDVGSEERFEILDIDTALGIALYLDDLESADGSRGGVGAVGGVGYDDLAAGGVAALLVIGTDDHQARQLTVGTGAGVEGEVGHSREGGEGLPEVVLHGEGALRGVVGLQRVEVGEVGHVGNLLVDGRVVLHRTRAKGVEAIEHAEVVATVVGVVAYDRHLVAFGEDGICGALFIFRQRVMGELVVGQRIGASTGLGKLKDERAV